MTGQKKECFFVCEDHWFNGDDLGDTKVIAVNLGSLTFHEMFEVFESAVHRKIAEFYANREYEDGSVTFRDRNAYLKEIQEEISESLGKFFYSDVLNVDTSCQKMLYDHIGILINTHIRTYPMSANEIDGFFESRIISILDDQESLRRHICQRLDYSSVPADQNTDIHDCFNQSLESIICQKKKIIEHLCTIKDSLLQRKIQLPFLEISHYGGGGAYSTTSYKIACQGLASAEPNWIELRLKDQAFRSQYPAIRKKLLNDLYEATSDKDILAKALSAAELLSTPLSLAPNSTNEAFSLIVERICNKFHLFAHHIKKRHGNRLPIKIEDEYDVQDLLHAILTIFFEDVRPEEYTPSYAGGSARMDFLLKSEQIVIETKMTRKGLTATKLGEELIVDKGRYKGHPNCKHLICFVYDPDHWIDNPIGIEKDLSGQENSMTTTVLIRPQI